MTAILFLRHSFALTLLVAFACSQFYRYPLPFYLGGGRAQNKDRCDPEIYDKVRKVAWFSADKTSDCRLLYNEAIRNNVTDFVKETDSVETGDLEAGEEFWACVYNGHYFVLRSGIIKENPPTRWVMKPYGC